MANTGNASAPNAQANQSSYMTSYIPGTNVPINTATPGGSYAQTGFGNLPDATHVTISPDILNSMQQYSDAAYHNATRTLDPQWQQNKAAFDQQMVGQGLMPGSDAYNNAYANFQRGQNDAYSQARDQSMQQGLAAQGQAFNQGYQNSSLQNELAKANTAANASMYDALMSSGATTQAAQIGANASMNNNAQDNFTQQLLGLGNLGLGAGRLNLDSNLGYGQLGLAQNNADFSNMLNLANFDRQGQMYNNALPGMELQNMMPFFGMLPNGNPSPIDVNGAYNLNANMQNSAYQGQQASANANNQMAGALGSAAIMAMFF